MRITKDTPPLSKKKRPPRMKWQKGDFSRLQEFRFHLPYGFLFLCKLWNVSPDDVLFEFMENLSCGSWKRDGKDAAKKHLQDYVHELGYGQQHYNKEARQKMFLELDSIGSLWPESAKMELIELHGKWREEYYKWWFKKWRNIRHRGGGR